MTEIPSVIDLGLKNASLLHRMQNLQLQPYLFQYYQRRARRPGKAPNQVEPIHPLDKRHTADATFAVAKTHIGMNMVSVLHG